jgi:hypothetical protein
MENETKKEQEVQGINAEGEIAQEDLNKVAAAAGSPAPPPDEGGGFFDEGGGFFKTGH